MEGTYKQEVSVGALVIMGAALFVGAMLWLTGRSIGGHGAKLDVAFANVSGLKIGDPVLVSGVNKGRVAAMRLVKPGEVAVTLALTADVAPRIDASAAVGSLDFFGAKFVDYNPGIRAEPLPADRVIQGTRGGELADLAGSLGQRAGELLDSAQALIGSRLGEDLHNTLVAVQEAMRVFARAGSGPLIAQTTATLAATERVLNRIDSTLAGAKPQRLDSLTANLNDLSRSLASTTANLDSVLGRIRRGEGTLGRMAADTLLYTNLTATLKSLNELLIDLRERPGRYLTVKVF